MKGWILTVGLLALSATALATPPAAAMLANACAGCHGTLGASAGPSMPILAGQSKPYLVAAMHAFRNGARPATIMGRLAKAYSDDEILALAEYFSLQKPPAPAQTSVAEAGYAKGREIHEMHCASCHVDSGRKINENAAAPVPVVAGQWLAYLQIQIDDFSSSKRRMNDHMAVQMKPLSRTEQDAVAHFYAGVK